MDDDARNPVKADPHFHIHVRGLDNKHYWKKYDESKAKYGEEPWPVHLKEMPELIIRFPRKGHPGNASRWRNLRSAF